MIKKESSLACKIVVKGKVQGVGFRPFVYRLASEFELCGYVCNRGDGVEIVVEGEAIEEFIQKLQSDLPPLASIDIIEKTFLPDEKFQTFTIKKSIDANKRVVLLPDITICEDCLADLFDLKSRRYHYPLINCTNCGPRYTIVTDWPYDRKNTTMYEYTMCPDCEKEYNDPKSRFYHAQPIGCNECGPKIRLGSYEGVAAIKEAARLIEEEKIVAIKGVGGFHLVCLAKSEAVVRLRKRKKRSKKPFAVMFPNIGAIKSACSLDKTEIALITSKERPIVVVQKRDDFSLAAPDIDRLGVFLPYNGIYALLFSFLYAPLVVTSANISDTPIFTKKEQVKKSGLSDAVLYYDREIARSCDDSVVSAIGDKSIFYRLSRGYAPKHFYLSSVTKPILAMGANQKNSIAFAKEHDLVLSPHIGDILTLESFEYFKKVVQDLQKIYSFTPSLIVCDKHPHYETNNYARSLGIEVLELQHHLAHVFAAKAEMKLTSHPLADERTLGFAWDGTGYGDDKRVWGGEVFVQNSRKYHFDYFKIVGGERALKDIRLIAWSLMRKYGFAVSDRLFSLAYEKNINTFETSSVGRLFDAVAFVSGLSERQEYEGYTGLLIEKAYQGGDQRYDFVIEKGIIQIDFVTLIKDKKELIATKFINTLVAIIVHIAKEEKLPVILSGGVFQNKTLLQRAIEKLERENIDYFFPTQTPINDGGIALGQVWYAVMQSH